MAQPISYEELMQMLQLGGETEGLDAQMKQQLAQAEQLRGGGAPQMRQAGRMMVAPHPMELLGGLAKQFAAVKMAKDAETTSGQIRSKKGTQNQMLLKALMQQQGMDQPNAGQGLVMPTGPSEGFNPNRTGY